jgi:hypothetical protein
VQLVRGGLIVHGLVAWSDDRRCGLKFSGRVDVQQWRAAPANLEQQRVDEVVRLVKAGTVPLPVGSLAQSREGIETPGSTEQLSKDLQRASDLLDNLGGLLASDADVVLRHGQSLQDLDIAMQVIAAVAGMVEGNADPRDGGAKLEALRRSADQALQRERDGSAGK